MHKFLHFRDEIVELTCSAWLIYWFQEEGKQSQDLTGFELITWGAQRHKELRTSVSSFLHIIEALKQGQSLPEATVINCIEVRRGLRCQVLGGFELENS